MCDVEHPPSCLCAVPDLRPPTARDAPGSMPLMGGYLICGLRSNVPFPKDVLLWTGAFQPTRRVRAEASDERAASAFPVCFPGLAAVLAAPPLCRVARSAGSILVKGAHIRDPDPGALCAGPPRDPTCVIEAGQWTITRCTCPDQTDTQMLQCQINASRGPHRDGDEGGSSRESRPYVCMSGRRARKYKKPTYRMASVLGTVLGVPGMLSP